LNFKTRSNESTIREVPEERKISLDIQAVLTVLGERKYSFNDGEYKCLNLRKAHLKEADLSGAHLEGANLKEAHLERANLKEAHLEEADLSGVHLEGANLKEAHLEGANLKEAHLEEADLREAHLEKAILIGAHLEEADLSGAHLEEVDLSEAYLERAKNLTIDQLSKVKTLYEAKLDDKLLIPLKEKHPELFEKSEQDVLLGFLSS